MGIRGGEGLQAGDIRSSGNPSIVLLNAVHGDVSGIVMNYKIDLQNVGILCIYPSSTFIVMYFVTLRQESLIESQFEENMMIKSMVNLMKEQLRNLTQDDISLEEEIKNTTNAILILARRLNKQSSAIRLLSDQADTQGEQMKAKLDNVSIALMTLDTQNNIKYVLNHLT